MDIREKLVGLLDDMQRSGTGYFGSAIENKKIADYLITHGVTVQEWISVNERLPEEKVRGLISAYRKKTGGRVALWEPDAPLTPAFLDEKVSAFCAQHESPVLFLDYLQLVAPARAGMTEKQTADAAVAMLKQLARRYDMPVIAASSLNREAYRPGSAEPGLSAFKESGSVEYSADLLLVLKYRTDADRENKTAPRHLALTI